MKNLASTNAGLKSMDFTNSYILINISFVFVAYEVILIRKIRQLTTSAEAERLVLSFRNQLETV